MKKKLALQFAIIKSANTSFHQYSSRHGGQTGPIPSYNIDKMSKTICSYPQWYRTNLWWLFKRASGPGFTKKNGHCFWSLPLCHRGTYFATNGQCPILFFMNMKKCDVELMVILFALLISQFDQRNSTTVWLDMMGRIVRIFSNAS